MKNGISIGVALAVAVGAVVACSSDNKGGSGGNNAFPFSGPSCPAGTQSTTQPGQQGGQTSAACSQCSQSSCSSQAHCVATDCADFFNCFCACAQGDVNCYLTCKLSSACFSCSSTISQCVAQNCASACTVSLDGGFGGD